MRPVEGDRSTLLVTTSVGPRVLGLFAGGDDTFNVMAVLPDATLERDEGPPFRLVGGHRLWAAPEVPAVTYQPDDRPCTVTEVPDGVRVEAPRDGAGLVRSIEIRASGDRWLVDHELRNGSEAPTTVAPWAITQLRSGGIATLALGDRGSDAQADRSVVLWPYTDLDDPRPRFGADDVTVDAMPGDGPLKVGAEPGAGALTYRVDGRVFEKRTDALASRPHADRGAAVQVYVRHDFCELETLGPLVTLAQGERASDREIWSLRDAPS